MTEPGKLLGWLEQHIQRDLNAGVRDRIEAAADGPSPGLQPELPPADARMLPMSMPLSPRRDNPADSPPLLGLPVEEMDFGMLLTATRRRAGKIAARLEAEEARAAPNARILNTLEKQFTAVSESMRKLELAALAVSEKAGQYAKIEQMTGELAKIHGGIATEIFSLFDRFIVRAEDKTRAEQRAIYRDEVNKMFARFQKNRFAAGLTESTTKEAA